MKPNDPAPPNAALRIELQPAPEIPFVVALPPRAKDQNRRKRNKGRS